MIASADSLKPKTHPLEHSANRKCPVTGYLIPRDVPEALEMRRVILEAARQSADIQESEWNRCKHSFLYWANFYGWTYVIRKYGTDGKVVSDFARHVPFVTWPVQDAAALQIIDCIFSGQDFLIDKSRDMGASWLLVLIVVWLWLFHDDKQLGFCSRIEDDVDKAGNPKSIFWKADYLIQNLPEWMIPGGDLTAFQRGGKYRRALIIENPVNGSVIRGEATTEHMFRGDRLDLINFDEMASQERAREGWASASDSAACKGANSTPTGPGTEYTRLRNDGLMTGQPQVITLGYWDHPDKGRGREWVIDEDGSVTGVAGDGYFDCPFFRQEVKRRTLDDLAQNVLIKHTMAGNSFFNTPKVTQHAGKMARDPQRYELVNGKFEADPEGPWFVWGTVDERTGKLTHQGNWTLFCDLSQGKGKSNSACAVMDESGTFWAEYVSPWVTPHDLADVVCEAGKTVFKGVDGGDAFLGWEENGPGESFYQDVLRNDYRHVYYRRQTGQRGERRSKAYGWRSDRTKKRHLLRQLDKAIQRGEVIIYSRKCLEEMLEYVYYDDGSVGPGMLQDEMTGAREAHGDRVIAYAGCVLLGAERHNFRQDDDPGTFAPGTMGAMLGHDEVGLQ